MANLLLTPPNMLPTLVPRAPNGGLEDVAVGLGWGPIELADVAHGGGLSRRGAEVVG